MARDDPYFRLRIPEPLLRQVQEAAEANKRSATAEIVTRLEDTFSGDIVSIRLGKGMTIMLQEAMTASGRSLSEEIDHRLLVSFSPYLEPGSIHKAYEDGRRDALNPDIGDIEEFVANALRMLTAGAEVEIRVKPPKAPLADRADSE